MGRCDWLMAAVLWGVCVSIPCLWDVDMQVAGHLAGVKGRPGCLLCMLAANG